MANEDNLVPLSTRQAREIGSKGGKASVKKKQERKLLKERLLTLLAQPNGDCTKSESICLSLIGRALEGDTKAFEVIRDTIGEKPGTDINIAPNNRNKIVFEIFDPKNGELSDNHNDESGG